MCYQWTSLLKVDTNGFIQRLFVCVYPRDLVFIFFLKVNAVKFRTRAPDCVYILRKIRLTDVKPFFNGLRAPSS